MQFKLDKFKGDFFYFPKETRISSNEAIYFELILKDKRPMYLLTYFMFGKFDKIFLFLKLDLR